MTIYQLDEASRVTAVTDPLGHVTHIWYDEYGYVTARADPLGRLTRYAYDERGNLTGITRPDGSQAKARYHDDNLPVAVTGPEGDGTRYARDAAGRVTAITAPDGAVTTRTWTPGGQLAERMFPDGSRDRREYDAEGNLASYLSPSGEQTRYEYGPFDQLTAVTGPDGVRTEFRYDHGLRLTAVTRARLTWRYDYDAAGRLVAETDFNGAVTRYAYDPAGQLTSRVNAVGQEVTFGYDELGRLVRRVADGAVSTFSYDAAGRPVLLEAGGHTLAFGYDGAGREIRRELPGGAALTQDWDTTGQLTRQLLTAAPTSADTRVATPWTGDARDGSVLARRAYTYRADGCLAIVDDLLAGLRRFTLDGQSRITAVTGDRWAEHYRYDPAGNLASARWSAPPPGAAYVAHPADPMVYGQQAPRGSRYVEFDVPHDSVAPAGKAGWAQIPGPDSLYGRIAAMRGLPIPQFPPAVNIEWLLTK